MTLLVDLVLVIAGLLRSLAAIDLAVIALGNGVLWLEIPLLVVALSLPSVKRIEQENQR
jgi:hypothetical protein